MNVTLGYFHTIWCNFDSSYVKKISKTRSKAYSSRFNINCWQETVALCPLLVIYLEHNFISFKGCPCPFLGPHFFKIIKVLSLQPSKPNGLCNVYIPQKTTENMCDLHKATLWGISVKIRFAISDWFLSHPYAGK